ncbi:MAG: hypothetical protein QXL15_04755, partial [Candidatus Korarchaeota archaeon]
PLDLLNVRQRNDIINYLTAVYLVPVGFPPPRKVKVTRKDIENALERISSLLKEEVPVKPVEVITPVKVLSMEELLLEFSRIKAEIDRIMEKSRTEQLTTDEIDRARILYHRLMELKSMIEKMGS